MLRLRIRRQQIPCSRCRGSGPRAQPRRWSARRAGSSPWRGTPGGGSGTTSARAGAAAGEAAAAAPRHAAPRPGAACEVRLPWSRCSATCAHVGRGSRKQLRGPAPPPPPHPPAPKAPQLRGAGTDCGGKWALRRPWGRRPSATSWTRCGAARPSRSTAATGQAAVPTRPLPLAAFASHCRAGAAGWTDKESRRSLPSPRRCPSSSPHGLAACRCGSESV
mmetsp:Transcript_8153/g.19391  ORF Transcript_8153/g.19391 Transcript_8153/m.19391 type:complete len:220 (-) Transcript_8153:107-766(-)